MGVIIFSIWILNQPSDELLTFRTGGNSKTNLSASLSNSSTVFDASTEPEVTSASAKFYKDGCGGGWCKAYIVQFENGSEYSLMFSGDAINDTEIKAILTSMQGVK